MIARPAPMLCTAARSVPEGSGWALQAKHDGWRFLWARDDDGTARAWTRSGGIRDGCHPQLDAQLSERVGAGTILDGELVALRATDDGRVLHDFRAIAGAIANGCEGLHYVVFDVLALEGRNLCLEPWSVRQDALRAVLGERLPCASLAQVLEPTQAQHEQLVALGFEGSVVKRTGSRYLPGRRSRSWLKLKARFERDVVIAGFGPRSGAVERVRCVSPDGEGLGWAELWQRGRGERIDRDRRAWLGRRARVAYSSLTAAGELREARVVSIER